MTDLAPIDLPLIDLPLVDLPRDPRLAGRVHGEAAREAIGANLALYFRRFTEEAQVSPRAARARGTRYLQRIDQLAPDYGQMVRGIAEGSGRSLPELGALNARYEILYSEYSEQAMATRRGADGCTAFAALPAVTPDGHLRLGQNWDWLPGVRGLLLRSMGEDGLRVLAFTEAGIAGGKIGLNSAGLGLAINGLTSERDDWRRPGLPFHVRTWRALHAGTLEGAVGAVSAGEHPCAANFLLARAGSAPGCGRAVDVETAPGARCAVLPGAGLLVHANHFADPGRLGVQAPVEDTVNSAGRARRMATLLEGRAGRLDDGALQAVLADHEGFPCSICHHEDGRLPAEERLSTRLSVVMDLHARQLLVAPGNPCVTPYARYGLD